MLALEAREPLHAGRVTSVMKLHRAGWIHSCASITPKWKTMYAISQADGTCKWLTLASGSLHWHPVNNDWRGLGNCDGGCGFMHVCVCVRGLNCSVRSMILTQNYADSLLWGFCSSFIAQNTKWRFHIVQHTHCFLGFCLCFPLSFSINLKKKIFFAKKPYTNISSNYKNTK